jgi:hypothetical protein
MNPYLNSVYQTYEFTLLDMSNKLLTPHSDKYKKILNVSMKLTVQMYELRKITIIKVLILHTDMRLCFSKF